jgi:cytochrome c biogenesis protein CcdA
MRTPRRIHVARLAPVLAAVALVATACGPGAVGTDNRAGGANAVGRALAVSGALTAGFVVVFGLFGLVVSPLAVSLDEHLPWVTIVVGIGLVGLGIALLAGRQLTLRIPKLHAGGRDGSLVSMFLFGVSYAVASLSCTIGPFLAVTTSTFRLGSVAAGVGVFLAYALGMGIVVGVLTVALALAKTSVVQRFRRALPVINRIAGALLVLAGAYVAYYGWYEIRVFRGDTDDPVVDRAIAIQAWLQSRVVPDNPTRVAALAVATLAVVTTGAIWRRRRSGPVAVEGDTVHAPVPRNRPSSRL